MKYNFPVKTIEKKVHADLSNSELFLEISKPIEESHLAIATEIVRARIKEEPALQQSIIKHSIKIPK